MFDADLLDVLMPEMDCHEVIAAINRDARLSAIPTIMVTALEDAERAGRCIALGAMDHLHKPVDPFFLRARLGAGIAKKRPRVRGLEYLRHVGQPSCATAAMKEYQLEATLRGPMATGSDHLGTFACLFQSMAAEVVSREDRLLRQVEQVRIKLDRIQRAQQGRRRGRSGLRP